MSELKQVMKDVVIPIVTSTLIQKLAEVGDAVGGVEKKGENKDQGYKYVKAADVAKAIRHELFQRGIVILADEKDYKERHFETRNGGKPTEATITTVYTITDGKDSIQLTAYGIGRDNSDKAIYKAKTGCLKYFLRQIALMPDEKEDPETTHIEEGDPEKEHLERLEPKLTGQKRIAPGVARSFIDTAHKHNKTNEEISQFLHDLNGYVQAEELTTADWDAASKWATTPAQDLTAIAQASLQKVNGGR